MHTIHEPVVLQKVKQLVDFYYYKFSLREPREDVFHEVVFSLMRTGYIERWDDTKPLHNYLSGFIFNFFCKVYKKEGYAVAQASGLETQLTDQGDFTLLSTIDSASSFDPDDHLEYEALLSILDTYFPFYTFLVYSSDLRLHGIFSIDDKVSFDSSFVIVPRSASLVFSLLYSGFTQAEIKDTLFVSKAWTSKIVDRIKSLEEVRRFARSKGFKV